VILSGAGINVSSPQFQAAEHACKSVIPRGFRPETALLRCDGKEAASRE